MSGDSIDLRDTNRFFVMRSFEPDDKGVVYGSNARTVEIRRYLNRIPSVTILCRRNPIVA
jgi:hypothetical protein